MGLVGRWVSGRWSVGKWSVDLIKPDFTVMDQHRSEACTKAFNLLLYEYNNSLCLTQA